MIDRRWLLLLLLAVSLGVPAARADEAFPLQAKRILFLGDSITHAGHYVAVIETQLRLHGVEPLPEIINIGLGSETLSGLTEPVHPYPRPDVHERLERALKMVKPDVVVACYGMNDGIYHPFGEDRFRAYQNGVNRLIDAVHASGAKLVLLTPPPFDPVPVRTKGKLQPAGAEQYGYSAAYENYDDVLARYSDWIMQQDDRVDMVVDVHGPFVRDLTKHRKSDTQFTYSPDGVHPNEAGHRLIGNTVLRAWGITPTVDPPKALLALVAKRLTLLHDAWLTAVGHNRPGVSAGLPLDQAQAQADELESQIEKLVQQSRPTAKSRRQATRATRSDDQQASESTVYKTVDGRELKLYVKKPENWKPSDKRPAIVFYHGGGWVGGAPGQFNEHSSYFNSRGLVTVQVQYRLLEGKTKDPPTVCVQDAKSAMRWVRSHAEELGIDPGRIASAGGSAGGHLAAFVGMVDGSDDPHDDQTVSAKSNAMLLFNPVFDNGPGSWGYERTRDRFKEFSPAHNVSSDDPPAIVFLGAADALIPVATAERFKKAMTDAGNRCELHVYEGQPHGFFNYGRADNRYYRETVLAADRFLNSLGWLTGEPTLESSEK